MAEMPTGAVTFLFTDIEGSTRLVKQLRDRYSSVLADHQRLLRAAFEAHGGYEVDTQGDSFFVAFASAREAVLAAVEGQRALFSNSWPDGTQIRVRMGLHTGQAFAHGGRYTGLAVHRAARIGAAGHGGQILLSQATQTLLEDEEEDLDVSLDDLGEQRLKDLDRPVRLYQVSAGGLPSSFPPVRGDAALAQAAEAAIAPPIWRRPLAVAAAAAAVALAVALTLVVVLGGRSGGLGAVQPNHVGVIDVRTNKVTAEIPGGKGCALGRQP
jgi:class 3 adenylate cyclase